MGIETDYSLRNLLLFFLGRIGIYISISDTSRPPHYMLNINRISNQSY